jgi:phosphoglycolate phosphatase-like HAD superfamily hydrolase
MTTPDPACLLFDLDGTLVRLGWGSAAVIAPRDEARRILRELGLRPPLGMMIPTLAELGQTRAHPEAARVLDELERAAAAGATPCAGAAEVLLACKRAGLRCAIVSNNGRACIEQALRCAGLLSDATAAIDAIVGREDVRRYKPDPEPLRRALSLLGWQSAALAPALKEPRAFMIGDAPSDIQAARALSEAEVVGVGVLTGLGDEAALRAAGAHAVLRTLHELLPLLARE